MQLDNHNQLLANNINLICSEIEIAIWSSLTVKDCVVLKRQIEKLKQELVAYIVPSNLFTRTSIISFANNFA